VEVRLFDLTTFSGIIEEVSRLSLRDVLFYYFIPITAIHRQTQTARQGREQRYVRSRRRDQRWQKNRFRRAKQYLC